MNDTIDTNTNQFGQIMGNRVENCLRKSFPTTKELRGQFCTLVPLDIEAHKAQLFEAFANQPEIFTYIPFGPFDIESTLDYWLNDTHLYEICFVVFDNKTNKPAGLASYHSLKSLHGVIEIGVSYSKQIQKTTAGTEAMYLMMREAFDNLGYRRLQWHCSTLNMASKNAAERLGFVFEGIFRHHYVFKERNHDTAWYSILDSEWPTVKTRIEKWLHPSNFDHEGRQITRLQNILPAYLTKTFPSLDEFDYEGYTETNQFGQRVGMQVSYWTNRKIPIPRRIDGRFCAIVPLSIEEHGKALFAAFKENQEEIFAYLPFGPFENESAFIDWLKDRTLVYLCYAIIDLASNTPQGIICYLNIIPEHGVIEIGSIIYSKALQKTGGGTEAIYLMLGEAFVSYGYRRCQWQCNALNMSSRNAALRIGFVFEAIFHQYYIFKERNRDNAYYSILDTEWPQVRYRLETWLHPDNFDANGRQITSLRHIY